MKIGGRIFIVALLFAVVTRVAAADEIIERVVAVAAGDVITQTDVAAARDLGLVQVSDAGDPSREIISRLIDRALMLAEVDRYAPPEPSTAAIDSGVQAVRARFDTPPAFDAALAKVGMDERSLRDAIRQDLRIRAYLDLRFVVAPATDAAGLAAAVARRDALVTAWVEGLRRRATITEVDVTGR
jgi:hypothetical protein